LLIKPLIFFIERRDADIYDSNFSYGPVAAAGLYENGGKRLDRDNLAVELHLAGAFQYKVNFGQLFMIMRSRILLDIDDVHCGGGIIRYGKCSLGKTARTFDRVNIAKMCYHIVYHTFSLMLYTVELLINSVYILPDVCDFIKIRMNLF